jgi:hypothetical protein
MPDVSNFINAFETFGRTLFDSMSNMDSLFFIVFIVFFFLIFAMCVAIMTKLPIFSDGGKTNSQGKVLSFIIAIMATYGLFFYKTQPNEVALTNLLNFFGIYSWVVLVVLVFAVIFFWVWRK